jgi:hypothetical protein
MNKGYLIVLKPEVNIARYEAKHMKGNEETFREFRAVFSKFNPQCYRGISRSPFESHSEIILKTLFKKEKQINKAAQLKLREIIPEATADIYDDCLISEAKDAHLIYQMLEDRDNWEIINIRRNNIKTDDTILGFDVGYWGGDHFSLIADVIVTPMWHPPAPDDWAEVAEKLSCLNRNLLFETPEAAAEFKAYYKTKPWAETEYKDDFCIIQINEIQQTKL